MKFNYSLIKKLATKIPEKTRLIEGLNFHAFEAVDAKGETVEISIPANRYSDSASHWGIAKTAAAIFGGQAKDLAKTKDPRIEVKKTQPEVKISAKKECGHYIARYFELPRVVQSPQWLKEFLISCGLRPISAPVDVMNYVMLEVGQPLHAFDADLVVGAIDIRLAKKGEAMTTIDGNDFKLNSTDLVIADDKGLLAIAGIKGGKRAEITIKTKKIIVESANFEPTGIYSTSRSLNLFTDASSRFSHGLSPALAEVGMRRAAELLKEICGARVGELTDVNHKRLPKILLKFDIEKFNLITNLDLKERVALDYLKRAGFKIKGKLVEAPPFRNDISIHEDLVEEVVNLYGYEKLSDRAPAFPLIPAAKEDAVILKENVREFLRGFGLSEVYNHSFVSRKDLTNYADPKWWGAVSLLNPISADFQYLRPNLALNLFKNLEDNLRFYNSVNLFEIGKVFSEKGGRLEEKLTLGIGLSIKKGPTPIFELKGVVDGLLGALGLTDYFFRDLNWEQKILDEEASLRIESDHRVVGYLGVSKNDRNTVIAELNLEKLLELVQGEKEFRPLPKFPSVLRDLSIIVDAYQKVGPIQDLIENGSHLLEDVDLIDWYEDIKLGRDKKSLTFRLVFQARDRTLTDAEVGKEMEKIIASLQEKFDAETR